MATESAQAVIVVKISVVIPCYNEAATILEIVRRVRRAGVDLHEIIVVNDCSTDATAEVLASVADDPQLRVFHHERNQGKGAALRTGFSKVSGDVIIIQDADLEYDPAEYRILLNPILRGQADVVFGSRFMGGRPHRVVYFWHLVGNRLLTLISNMFTNINLSDMETCFKVFTRDVLSRLRIEEDRFGVEPEMTAKIAKMNCRIFEVGISYYGRTYAEGKKIGWRDGFRAIYAIVKYNLFR
jgi:glycosyltransferase involved in cell wall biosynthesis